ncbi:recombinase family protein [Salinigranum sp. GCM10025319]|uniref:recombinase family protein n=1 Tax=Salinigranum sp. GCM10025319 TaxID=3252687 RepID=UPI00362063C5
MLDTASWMANRGEEDCGEVRAAIYARTSKTSRGVGYSLDEQVRLCMERCEMYGWRPVFVLQDDGESGKDVGRPGFQVLMDNAERQLFDVAVFWKLDRFSRTLLHAVQLEKQLREWDVALHSVTEQIDTTSSAGRFNFRNIASAAEFERDMIRERTKMGHTALAMEGKWPNNTPPIGYSLSDDRRLEINRSEAAIVRDIFENYVAVKSMPEVAQQLNDTGVMTKRDSEWCSRSVGEVLRNRIYVGLYTVAGIQNEVPEYRILDDDLFQSVTEVRNRFQTEDARRNRMDLQRKKRLVGRILTQYESFTSEKSASYS